MDLLEAVRHLKSIGVEVRFEKENISSMSGDGELMLTILASFAQEESRSISDNVKWGTRKRFAQGIPNGRFRVYGYRWEGDALVVIPEEAAIVRRIFQNFLDGKSRLETEREFAAEGIVTRSGCRWMDSNIKSVLTNSTYTGNLTLQKYFAESPITHRQKRNRGELPQYLVENSHEAIIDKATFDFVQKEMERRKELGVFANKAIHTTCFTSKIKCGICHRSYIHSLEHSKNGFPQEYWMCSSKKRGKSTCASFYLPEKILRRVCADVLGMEEFDEDAFQREIETIVVTGRHDLSFRFHDGRIAERHWEANLKKEYWTEERRKAKAEYLKNHPLRRCFLSGKVRCGNCGETFERKIGHPRQDGTRAQRWYCRGRKSGCGIHPIDESILTGIYMEIQGGTAFSEAQMEADVDFIAVVSNDAMVFHMSDGREIRHAWEKAARAKFRTTEEAKEKQRKARIEYWRKRHAEDHNNYTGDHQPLHGSSD